MPPSSSAHLQKEEGHGGVRLVALRHFGDGDDEALEPGSDRTTKSSGSWLVACSVASDIRSRLPSKARPSVSLVRVFQVATHREAAGQAGDPEAHGSIMRARYVAVASPSRFGSAARHGARSAVVADASEFPSSRSSAHAPPSIGGHRPAAEDVASAPELVVHRDDVLGLLDHTV